MLLWWSWSLVALWYFARSAKYIHWRINKRMILKVILQVTVSTILTGKQNFFKRLNLCHISIRVLIFTLFGFSNHSNVEVAQKDCNYCLVICLNDSQHSWYLDNVRTKKCWMIVNCDFFFALMHSKHTHTIHTYRYVFVHTIFCGAEFQSKQIDNVKYV